jgi:hypothetical protein
MDVLRLRIGRRRGFWSFCVVEGPESRGQEERSWLLGLGCAYGIAGSYS